MQKAIIAALVCLILQHCQQSLTAEKVIEQAIKAHGQNNLIESTVRFSFRNHEYSVTRKDNWYRYTRTQINREDTIRDVLINSADFVRLINGDTVPVVDTMATKYTSSVNSVLYFFQLPFVLNDPAVNASYEGTEKIKNENYHIIRVTFDQQGGGEDFQDEYRYWFDTETYLLNYLAYNYETDGGGVRFREVLERKEQGGIIFQDYNNYEVPIGTPLESIPKRFEQDQLKKLSTIINTQLQVL